MPIFLRTRLLGMVVAIMVLLGQSTAVQAAPLPVCVASWNVFDLPGSLFHVAAGPRMQRIPEALGQSCSPWEGLDAVAFSELYVRKHRDMLLAALAARGLPYTAVLQGSGIKGRLRWQGVVVASRWPIDKQQSIIFEGACRGADCLATKGALYVRLLKAHHGQLYPVHLVATHLYLGKPTKRQESRRNQAAAIQQLIAQQSISADEPLILAGDLNAPWHADGPSLLHMLGAHPFARVGPLDHTFVGRDHVLAGSPFQSLATRCKKTTQVMTQVPDNSRIGRKWVDYVVALQPGAQPKTATLQALAPAAGRFNLGSAHDARCSAVALSDHHLVVGTFEFGLSRARPASEPETRSKERSKG